MLDAACSNVGLLHIAVSSKHPIMSLSQSNSWLIVGSMQTPLASQTQGECTYGCICCTCMYMLIHWPSAFRGNNQGQAVRSLLKTILSCTGDTSVVDQVVNALENMEICNVLGCCLGMVHNALQSMLTKRAVPSDEESLSTCMLLVHATSRLRICKRAQYCLCRLLRDSDLSGDLAPARTTVWSFARTCNMLSIG